MGQTLACAAQWTSAREGTKGKLELTPVNETILNEMVSFVENVPQKNPEVANIVFKKPLTWMTTLIPSDVASQTDEQSADGQPLVSIKAAKGGTYQISVLTLEKAEQILAIAGDKKIVETRACLECK